MLSGVIVTHASLARALRDAAASVAGEASHLETVSNDGLSPEQILQEVRAAVQRAGGDGCILFVDLLGGSCATSCLQALRGIPNARVITGVNLAMLADFVARRQDFDLDAMVARLLQRGHASIQELKGS